MIKFNRHNILGLIPKNWAIKKFDEVAELIHGYQFRTTDFTDEGIKVFKITQIKGDGIIDISNCDFIDSNRLDDFKKNQLKYDDILMALTGATIGKIARFKSEEICLQNYRVGKFISRDKSAFSEDYLYYFLSSNLFFHQLLARQTQSAQQNIGKEDINNMTICFPDLATQTSIAEILSSIDDKIELNNKINQELETLAQTLFKQWFIDFEFPNENGEPFKSSGGEMVDSELGEIPKGWFVQTLKDEFIINMGQSPSGDTYNTDNDGMIFFQGRSDFGFRFPSIRMYTNAPKKVAKKFETLISVRAPVGDINMAADVCCIGRGLGSISHAKKLYTYTYYKILSIQAELKSYDNEGTVFGSINKETLGNIKTIIPPILLCEKFEDLFKEIDSKIYNLDLETQNLIKTRDTLLPKLISGELEINEITN